MSDAEGLREFADHLDKLNASNNLIRRGFLGSADLRRIADRLEALDTVTIRTPRGFEGETSELTARATDEYWQAAKEKQVTEPNSAFEAKLDAFEVARDAFKHCRATLSSGDERFQENKRIADKARLQILDAYAGVVAERDHLSVLLKEGVTLMREHADELAAAKAEIERLTAENDKQHDDICELRAQLD